MIQRFLLGSLGLLLAHSAASAATVQVPDWARDAVWYQIFPERFRNGDPRNDPTAKDLELPSDRPWQISPWTSDWYARQPGETHTNFYWASGNRRYGGDLQGVIDKLDYIKKLGVNAIYFNPVFESFSSHKYDASNFHHIDHTFGPDPAGDLLLMQGETDQPSTWRWSAADKLFLTLLQEAHARGIRVIIDGVFNHTGTRCFAFQDVLKNQQKSRYATWYDIKEWDDSATPRNEFNFVGWFGHKSLPELRETEQGFDPTYRQYIAAITRRWMDPNNDGNPANGIDGWRLDVANQVAEPFWREWRTQVKAINPQAYITGEIWDNASRWLQGDQFDAVMNYSFAKASIRFFIHSGTNAMSVRQFDAELLRTRTNYPAEVNLVLQNLYDSHDTDRLGSMILNPNRGYDKAAGPGSNPRYDIAKPGAPARAIQKLMVLFQMTYLGAPMLYYGNEAGMWGADDPDDRKPMLWADDTYQPEQTDPRPGRTRPPDPVVFDQELFDYYQKMIALRRENEALRRGTFTTVLTEDERGLFGFERRSNSNRVVVVLNNHLSQQQATITLAAPATDLLSKKQYPAGACTISLAGKTGAVLLLR